MRTHCTNQIHTKSHLALRAQWMDQIHRKSHLAMRSQWTEQIHMKSHLAISNEISYSMFGADLHDFSFNVLVCVRDNIMHRDDPVWPKAQQGSHHCTLENEQAL